MIEQVPGEEKYRRDCPVPTPGSLGVETWYDNTRHNFIVVRHHWESHNIADPVVDRTATWRFHIVTTCRYVCPCHYGNTFRLWEKRWSKCRMI